MDRASSGVTLVRGPLVCARGEGKGGYGRGEGVDAAGACPHCLPCLCTHAATPEVPLWQVFYMELVRLGNIKGDKPRLSAITDAVSSK